MTISRRLTRMTQIKTTVSESIRGFLPTYLSLSALSALICGLIILLRSHDCHWVLGAHGFRTHQFDIERMCCTTTVFKGSSHSPPSEAVVASNICSSTRK